MNDSEDGAGRTRRETSAAVLVGREARLLVAPVQEKLGVWQAETVKLEVMSQRLRAAGRNDGSIAESASTMLSVIGMQQQMFETAVGEAPEVVRSHSRVADTAKVLAMLIARLEKILAEVGEPSDKPQR